MAVPHSQPEPAANKTSPTAGRFGCAKKKRAGGREGSGGGGLGLGKEELTGVVTRVLGALCESNAGVAAVPSGREAESLFYSVVEPAIGLREYVGRLVRHAGCGPAGFVVALVYLDRLARRGPRLLVVARNLHRLLTTALLLAAKFLDDAPRSNAHFARVGGVATVAEMNRLELAMLRGLRYRLFVPPRIFAVYEQALLDHARALRAVPAPLRALPRSKSWAAARSPPPPASPRAPAAARTPASAAADVPADVPTDRACRPARSLTVDFIAALASSRQARVA